MDEETIRLISEVEAWQARHRERYNTKPLEVMNSELDAYRLFTQLVKTLKEKY